VATRSGDGGTATFPDDNATEPGAFYKIIRK
jgi:hypothetical protein